MRSAILIDSAQKQSNAEKDGYSMNRPGRLAAAIDVFESKSREILAKCRIIANDGTILYSPDGSAHYTALWCRDFAYMAEYAGDLLPNGHVGNCMEYLIKGTRREDGWICDWRNVNGESSFSPAGGANLDNGPFLVFAMDAWLSRQPEEVAGKAFGKWRGVAARGLTCLPLSDSGLIWNDPASPHSPYGFTDCVCKTGELFFESVLLWRACRMMAKWSRITGYSKDADAFSKMADDIVVSLPKLCDEKTGMYYAATLDCRQIDIWGSAYAAYSGLLPESEITAVADYFITNHDTLVMKGQVRHLPHGELWNRMLIKIEDGEYQNGAYWATPSGWVAWTIAQRNEDLAINMLADLAGSFISEGVFECINGNYTKLPQYVVSAVNPLGGALRMAIA